MNDQPENWSDTGARRAVGEAEPEPSVRAATPRLQGKIVLVTGGGTGIGRAIATLFAREGASVIVAGRRSEPLQETVRDIRREGGVVTFARGDVSRSDRVEMLVQAAVYNFGGLDVLVNNAGLFLSGTIEETDERRWDRIMGTNLKGAYLVTRHALPAMRQRGGGSIINIASADALTGAKGAAAYAASKGGLVALTKSLAADVAADRIRVNAICPGPVARPSGSETTSGGPARAADAATIPGSLGRTGTPQDVAGLALYLASDESSWVTGSVFSIDGGLVARG
jgi:NAD(P)-dependent dehydrogenase (short-subunit alcohol dehydrogenase family)